MSAVDKLAGLVQTDSAKLSELLREHHLSLMWEHCYAKGHDGEPKLMYFDDPKLGECPGCEEDFDMDGGAYVGGLHCAKCGYSLESCYSCAVGDPYLETEDILCDDCKINED